MSDSRSISEIPLLAHWPHESDWTPILSDFFRRPQFRLLSEFVSNQRQHKTVYPRSGDVFNAFRYCSYEDTKVVILGQDPYHGPGQAHGFCFSVPDPIRTPPSLRNIFSELHSDLGIENGARNDLSSWARQGVLLVNSVLTVEAGKAHSHQKQGWEDFTDFVIEQVANRQAPVVFVLWGNAAATKSKLIGPNHRILKSAHPSPLSAYRGFFGSKPFSTINQFLNEIGHAPIRWDLSD